MSPTVFQFSGIKIRIHLKDHNPPHVHVEGKGSVAVFLLETLEILHNDGFSRADVARIELELWKRHEDLKRSWDEYQK
jgi:hypothetical protein